MKKKTIITIMSTAAITALVSVSFFPDSAFATERSVVLKVSNASATTVTLKWKRQKRVKSYRIYRSLKRNSGYKMIMSTKKIKFKNEKLEEKRNYYYKVIAEKAGGRRITSNTVSKRKVRGNYGEMTVYGPDMTLKQRIQVKDAVAKFVNTKIRADMSDYEKVETAHDYLVKLCRYAASRSKNGANSAWGALIYREAQCSGYSRAFKALCDAMGIKCYYVHAVEGAVNPYHQWNMVRVGKRYYHIDVQCNDSSGFRAIYLVGDKTVEKIGLRWETGKFPRCREDYYQ